MRPDGVCADTGLDGLGEEMSTLLPDSPSMRTLMAVHVPTEPALATIALAAATALNFLKFDGSRMGEPLALPSVNQVSELAVVRRDSISKALDQLEAMGVVVFEGHGAGRSKRVLVRREELLARSCDRIRLCRFPAELRALRLGASSTLLTGMILAQSGKNGVCHVGRTYLMQRTGFGGSKFDRALRRAIDMQALKRWRAGRSPGKWALLKTTAGAALRRPDSAPFQSAQPCNFEAREEALHSSQPFRLIPGGGQYRRASGESGCSVATVNLHADEDSACAVSTNITRNRFGHSDHHPLSSHPSKPHSRQVAWLARLCSGRSREEFLSRSLPVSDLLNELLLNTGYQPNDSRERFRAIERIRSAKGDDAASWLLRELQDIASDRSVNSIASVLKARLTRTGALELKGSGTHPRRDVDVPTRELGTPSDDADQRADMQARRLREIGGRHFGDRRSIEQVAEERGEPIKDVETAVAELRRQRNLGPSGSDRSIATQHAHPRGARGNA